ncbi:MAG: OmpA family protein [Cetobacterium sp.]
MIRRNRKNEEEESSYWLSIGDLMAGALIIFVLLFVLQILNVNKKLAEKEQMLEDLIQLQIQVENLKGSLKKVVGIKQEIIKLIVKKFKQENLKIDIDPLTGNIKLDDSILFNLGSAELKPEGKNYLVEFIPRYVDVFFSNEKIREHITQIIIEGHTDNTGSYVYNLDLSQRRALSVVNFIYSDEMPNFKWKSELQKIITANGRSKVLLIKDASGNVDKNKSRRVEFQFKLDDEKANKEIQKIINSGLR